MQLQWSSVELMKGQSILHWPSIDSGLGQRLMLSDTDPAPSGIGQARFF